MDANNQGKLPLPPDRSKPETDQEHPEGRVLGWRLGMPQSIGALGRLELATRWADPWVSWFEPAEAKGDWW